MGSVCRVGWCLGQGPVRDSGGMSLKLKGPGLVSDSRSKKKKYDLRESPVAREEGLKYNFRTTGQGAGRIAGSFGS